MSSVSSAPSVQAAGADAQGAAARSGLYSLLAKCVAVPDEALHGSMADGSLVREFAAIITSLPYPLSVPALADISIPGFVELQSDYIGCFEVGIKGPACPLYEGPFRKDRGRKAVMEDLLRFYHYFGLKLSERARELPDHISAELEFMHYLSYLEAGLRAREAEGEGAVDLVRAQRDFLERHLAAWAPELDRRAGQRGAPPWYRALLSFLGAFTDADLKYLEEMLGC